MAERLLTILEFAAAIQPLIAPINAFNWLGDLRRLRKSYSKRTTHRPVWVKIGRVVHYPESELARTITGIEAYKAKGSK